MNWSTLSWIITIIVAVIIGTIIGIILVKKKTGNSFSDNLKPWDSLIQNQNSLDELNLSDIVAWCNECKKEVSDGDTLFLFKATQKNVRKLGYQYNNQIDENTNVIACKINTYNGDASNIQLFSFGILSDQVKQLFGEDDYAVIEF